MLDKLPWDDIELFVTIYVMIGSEKGRSNFQCFNKLMIFFGNLIDLAKLKVICKATVAPANDTDCCETSQNGDGPK